MKKLTWATSKSLFGQIATSSCLVAVSAGVVFGVSAGTFKVQYLNLNDPQARLKACVEHNYFSQNIKSQWNMNPSGTLGEESYIKGIEQPTEARVDETWWSKVHPGTTPLSKSYNNIDPSKMGLLKDGKEVPSGVEISKEAQAERQKYSALVIDGSTHTALDRSFNQGLYNGLANFNTNIQHDVVDNSEGQVYKPSQDSTQEFVNIYRAVAAKSRILALAGFNHVTPLNALGERDAETGLYKFADKNIANAGMMLMDGDVANNQNVASVLFRSDQPAFLAALATCMYFYNNLDMYHDHFQDISVAAYGGTAIPTVIIYMGGFQRGIEFFNEFVLKQKILNIDAFNYMKGLAPATDIQSDYFEKKLLPASKYKDEIETLKNTPAEQKTSEAFKAKVTDMLNKLFDEYCIKMIKLGDFATHFSGSFASGDAIGISKQYLNRGASAIIGVAGPQSLDTAQEVMNQHKNCIVIGVDSAMERSDYQKPFTNPNFTDKTVAASGDKSVSAQANNIIKFSAVKDMTNVSDKILRLAATGKHWDLDTTCPWLTAATIPSWTKDEEVTSLLQFTPVPDDDNYFDVTGFKGGGSVAEKLHVMNIPTTWTEGGKTRKLRAIYGFSTDDTAHLGILKNIDTLKISGAVDDGQRINFGNPDRANATSIAFDYSVWDASQGEKPGIKYIDLSEIPHDNLSFSATDAKGPFYKMSYSDETYTCKAYQNGICKTYPYDTNKDKEDTYSSITTNIEGTNDSVWAKIEPDPYSSICSFGFKTCGNIENGLISISWDGWPLLLEAFRHCKMIMPKTSTERPFSDAWLAACTSYAETHESELDEKFKTFLLNAPIEQYSTFDTNSVINKNYAHIMTILGNVLNQCRMSFPSNMTLLFDKTGAPYLPDEDTPLSVLDWLKFNMYFTM